MAVKERESMRDGAENAVEVHAFFEGAVDKEKGKIRLPYKGCAIYFGRLKREAYSNRVDFDGYVLEDTGFVSAFSDAYRDVMTKDMEGFLETVRKGKLPKIERKSLSDSTKETATKAYYAVINKLKNEGVKRARSINISDINVRGYREFDISKPEERRIVDQLNAFFKSDAKDFIEFIERSETKEAGKPQKIEKTK